MKRLLALLISLIILTLPLIAEDNEDSPWNIYAELDMYLGYKMGIKYELSDKLDLVSSFGVNALFPTQKSYSLYASYRSMSYDKIRVAVNGGIIQGVFDDNWTTGEKYFVISPGITMQVSYNLTDQIGIGAQGGMVLMVGCESNNWASSLEPYAGITFTFSK